MELGVQEGTWRPVHRARPATRASALRRSASPAQSSDGSSPQRRGVGARHLPRHPRPDIRSVGRAHPVDHRVPSPCRPYETRRSAGRSCEGDWQSPRSEPLVAARPGGAGGHGREGAGLPPRLGELEPRPEDEAATGNPARANDCACLSLAEKGRLFRWTQSWERPSSNRHRRVHRSSPRPAGHPYFRPGIGISRPPRRLPRSWRPFAPARPGRGRMGEVIRP
jgi:hypothetical protein